MKHPGKAERQRLIWLDLVRLLCALMILGIHWLRACYKNNLFAAHQPINIVTSYQGQTSGLDMLHYVLIEGIPHHLSTALNDAVGLFGEFGWEAVSALVVVSGFSLSAFTKLPKGGWQSWLLSRAKRILVPFYSVALPFLVTYFLLLGLTARHHGLHFQAINQKLHAVFHTPLLGVVISHVFLFDPFQPQGLASFFAPAWWFVPAILIAYCLYPVISSGIDKLGSVPILCIAACVTISTYYLSRHGVALDDSCWYTIVLQENFDFCLGIVLGKIWNSSDKGRLEGILFGAPTTLLGFALFLSGTVLNWSPLTQPIASSLFGPGIILMFCPACRLLEHTALARQLVRIDAYDLYLVHQPFAFPIALAMGALLKGFAISLGFIPFLVVSVVAAFGASMIQRLFLGKPRPSGPRPEPLVSVTS